MSRATRLQQLLEKRMGGGLVLMYHGTTSNNLRKVLKMGLSPNPGVKTWQDDPDVGFNRPSRASFEGVYLTENLMTAISSATTTTRKLGGNTLLIAALVQQRAGLPDEDDLVHRIERAAGDIINNEAGIKNLYNDIQRGRGQLLHQVYTRWLGGIAQAVGVPDRVMRQDIAQPLFIAIVTRKAAHLQMSYDFDPPNIQESEMQYRRALDRFMNAVKQIANNYRRGQEPRDTFGHTLRLKEPLTYRGRSRIVAVFEVMPDEGTKFKDRVYIRYGRSFPDFEQQWKSRVGELRWG